MAGTRINEDYPDEAEPLAEGLEVPNYHYRCKACGYDFTKHQDFNDEPIHVCPVCGREEVRKVYSAVPISFKGSGFYRTDSGK